MRTTISGQSCWFVPSDNYESAATGQYIPGKRLEMKFTSGGASYLVELQPSSSGSDWQGTYSVAGEKQHVAAKLYRAEDGSMALVGTWLESGNRFAWLASLECHDQNEDGE